MHIDMSLIATQNPEFQGINRCGNLHWPLQILNGSIKHIAIRRLATMHDEYQVNLWMCGLRLLESLCDLVVSNKKSNMIKACCLA